MDEDEINVNLDRFVNERDSYGEYDLDSDDDGFPDEDYGR